MSFTQQDLKFFSKVDAKRISEDEYLIEEGQNLELRVTLVGLNSDHYCVSIGTHRSTLSHEGIDTSLQNAMKKAYSRCNYKHLVVKDVRDNAQRILCQCMED